MAIFIRNTHTCFLQFRGFSQCADKEGNQDVRPMENQQTDQLNTSKPSSVPQRYVNYNVMQIYILEAM